MRDACAAWQKKNGGGKLGDKPNAKGNKTWSKTAKLSTKALKKMVNQKVDAIMANPKGGTNLTKRKKWK